jgi:hypothetical protein
MRTKIYQVLIEACRRYTRFHMNASMTEAWTGLGFMSEYKEAVEAGYMKPAHSSSKRCMGWFTLTPLGAGIVSAWIGAGYNYKSIEAIEGFNAIPPKPFTKK